MMANFQQVYQAKCKELKIQPLPWVMEYLDGVESGIGEQTLKLSGRAIDVKSCIGIAEALKGDTTFAHWNMADCFLGDEGSEALSTAIAKNKIVSSINWKGNGIRWDGIVALSKAIKQNTSIVKITLEWNTIGIWDAGVKALADALKDNNSVTSLDIRNNKIGPHGARALADMLRVNRILTVLDMRWNPLGMAGGKALASAMEDNRTICDIDLSGCGVGEDELQSLAVALTRNRQGNPPLHTSMRSSLGESTRLYSSPKRKGPKVEASWKQERMALKEHTDGLEQQITLERGEQSKQLLLLQRELIEEKQIKVSLEEAHRASVDEHLRHIVALEAELRQTRTARDEALHRLGVHETELEIQSEKQDRSVAQVQQQWEADRNLWMQKEQAMLQAHDAALALARKESSLRLAALETRLSEVESIRETLEGDVQRLEAQLVDVKVDAEKRLQNAMERQRETNEGRLKAAEGREQQALLDRQEALDHAEEARAALVKVHHECDQRVKEADARTERERAAKLQAESEKREMEHKVDELNSTMERMQSKLDTLKNTETDLRAELEHRRSEAAESAKEARSARALVAQQEEQVRALETKMRQKDMQLEEEKSASQRKLADIEHSLTTAIRTSFHKG